MTHFHETTSTHFIKYSNTEIKSIHKSSSLISITALKNVHYRKQINKMTYNNLRFWLQTTTTVLKCTHCIR